MTRAITFAVVALVLSLACATADAQCSKASQGQGQGSCNTGGGYPGGVGGGYGGGGNGGGGYGGGGYGGGGYPAEPYSAPYAGSQTGDFVENGPALPYEEQAGDYGVYIQHPLNGSYVLSKDFSKRSQAQRYVTNVQSRFWVTYRNAAGDLKFKEARTSGAARSLASQLRSQGNEVDQIVAVRAQIGKPEGEDLDLELLAASQEPPSESSTKTAEVTEPTTTPADLSFLVGTWQAVARNESGELTKVELMLDDHGWATLTVPGTDGDTSEIKRRAELKDGQLVLTGEGSDINLGKLASFDQNQVILDRLFGQVTFVRP